MDTYAKANAVLSKFCHGYMNLKKELPIRPSEMGVLNILVQREGPFTPVMIAELLDVSKPMITAHLAALEKEGYIKKEYSKEDKRSFYVTPTDKARVLVETSAEKMRRQLQTIESALGEEGFAALLGLVSDTNQVLTQLKGDMESWI